MKKSRNVSKIVSRLQNVVVSIRRKFKVYTIFLYLNRNNIDYYVENRFELKMKNYCSAESEKFLW